jgi:hypothetical protein
MKKQPRYKDAELAALMRADRHRGNPEKESGGRTRLPRSSARSRSPASAKEPHGQDRGACDTADGKPREAIIVRSFALRSRE